MTIFIRTVYCARLTGHMCSAHCICLSAARLCLSPALSLATGREDEMIKTVNGSPTSSSHIRLVVEVGVWTRVPGEVESH